MERQRWTDTAETRRAGSVSAARDERRAAIVDAAIAAIAEHGPDALTGQIADRAGLNRTHFYRHFASKAELDWAVAKRAHLEITERIRAALVVDGTPLDAIRAPIVAHVGWAGEHPNLYRFLLGRNYYRGKDMPRIGGSAFAAEISAAAVRYIPGSTPIPWPRTAWSSRCSASSMPRCSGGCPTATPRARSWWSCSPPRPGC